MELGDPAEGRDSLNLIIRGDRSLICVVKSEKQETERMFSLPNALSCNQGLSGILGFMIAICLCVTLNAGELKDLFISLDAKKHKFRHTEEFL